MISAELLDWQNDWRTDVEVKLRLLKREQVELKPVVEETARKAENCSKMLLDMRRWVEELRTSVAALHASAAEQKAATDALRGQVGEACGAGCAAGRRAAEAADGLGDGLRAVEAKVGEVEAEAKQTQARLAGAEEWLEALSQARAGNDVAAAEDADSVSWNGGSGKTTEPMVEAEEAGLRLPDPVEQFAPRVPAPQRPSSPGLASRSPGPSSTTSPALSSSSEPKPAKPARVLGSTGSVVEGSEQLALKKAVSACGKKAFLKAPFAAGEAGAKVLARFREGSEEMCFRHVGDDEWLRGVVRAGASNTLAELTQPRHAMYSPDGKMHTTALEDFKSGAKFGPPGTQIEFRLNALPKPEDPKSFTLFAFVPGDQLEKYAKAHAGEVVAAMVLEKEEEVAQVMNPLGKVTRADGRVTVYVLAEQRPFAGKVVKTTTGRTVINIDPRECGHQVGVWTAEAGFCSYRTALPDKHSSSTCPEPPLGEVVSCTLIGHGHTVLATWTLDNEMRPTRSPVRGSDGGDVAARISVRLAWKKGDGGVGLKGLSKGKMVTEVRAGSAADKAGLRAGLKVVNSEKTTLKEGGKVEAYTFEIPDGTPIRMAVARDASGLYVKPLGGAELRVGPNTTALKIVDRLPLLHGEAPPGKPALVSIDRKGNKPCAVIASAE